MGIEPTRLAWKARTLPLSYTRSDFAHSNYSMVSFARQSAQNRAKPAPACPMMASPARAI